MGVIPPVPPSLGPVPNAVLISPKDLRRPNMLEMVALTAVRFVAPRGGVEVVVEREEGKGRDGGVERVTEGRRKSVDSTVFEEEEEEDGAGIIVVVEEHTIPVTSAVSTSCFSSSSSLPEETLKNLKARLNSAPHPPSLSSSCTSTLFGASSNVCSQPTGGEPGGEMRKFRDRAGTWRRVCSIEGRGRERWGPKKARRGSFVVVGG